MDSLNDYPPVYAAYLPLSPRPNLLSRDGIEMTPGVRCARDKRPVVPLTWSHLLLARLLTTP